MSNLVRWDLPFEPGAGIRYNRVLHCQDVEAAVDNSHSAGDELRSVAHQIVDCAAEFLGFAHTAEGGLTDYIKSALGPAAVGVGQQCAVLLGQEETGGDGVHADPFAKLAGTLSGHEGGEVRDAGLSGGVTAYTGHRTEGCHRGEIDDCALSLGHHRLEEHLSGDYGTHQVEVQHLLELSGVEVEECLVGGNGGAGHIAAGSVQQSVDAAVFCHDFVAVGLDDGLVHDIGFQEFDGTGGIQGVDLLNDFLADLSLAAHDDDLSAVERQIFGNFAAEDAGTSGDDGDVALDIEKIFHYDLLFCNILRKLRSFRFIFRF